LLAPPAAPEGPDGPEGEVLEGDAPELPGVAPAADPLLEPLAPASDDPEEPLGVLDEDDGDEGEAEDDGDEGEAEDEGEDGEADGLALELPAPEPPAEPEEPALPPPIEEPEAPLLPLAPAGESEPDLLHPAIAMVMTLAASTILVVFSNEFIVVPLKRIVYPSIQIPLTPSVSISFTKFRVALPWLERQDLCRFFRQRYGAVSGAGKHYATRPTKQIMMEKALHDCHGEIVLHGLSGMQHRRRASKRVRVQENRCKSKCPRSEARRLLSRLWHTLKCFKKKCWIAVR
jgi:hypothetical protein